ncbi:MAG TPA: SynChlorMet cassette radical SAM/SPASM protein ScmE [Desulfomonilaceae bacterium]|nr:SynChlorMet cassette radical SAM/SPASM protein ScmE [Desulfomonilaceae bacterium]
MKIMNTPRTVDLQITGRCNLRCTYCSHFTSGGDTGEDLPAGDWLTFFEELGRYGVMDVCLQGGEPFCRTDLKEIIGGIIKNRMRFSVLTNGTLITDEMARFLASTGRCNSVQVSIDGADRFTHDTFRGAGSFRRAVEGLKTLTKHGIATAVRVTIHRQNVHDLANVARLLLEDFGLPEFSTNAASHLGLCRKNAAQVQLTAQERSLAMKSLLELSRKYGGRIAAQAGPLAEAREWLRIERSCEDGTEPDPDRGFLTGCGGPMTKMGIRADGIMVACSQLPDLALGRINGDDLKDVWLNHPELNRFRNRREIPLDAFAFCRGCPYIRHCTGNCPALAYTMLHDAWHPSPDACLRNFLVSGGTLPTFAE